MKSKRHEKREVTKWLDRSIIGQHSAAMKAAAVFIVAGAAACPAPSSAQATSGAESQMAELEKGFWVCDHAAMNGPMDRFRPRLHGHGTEPPNIVIPCRGTTGAAAEMNSLVERAGRFRQGPQSRERR
jgi:hypothetical protein